jgi:hypothetical protein
MERLWRNLIKLGLAIVVVGVCLALGLDPSREELAVLGVLGGVGYIVILWGLDSLAERADRRNDQSDRLRAEETPRTQRQRNSAPR